MENRIDKRLNKLKAEGKKAFTTYMTAGLPDMNTTIEIIKAQYEAGIDIIELGIPFSDPVADGPVIQTASYKAICQGVTLEKVFDMMVELRKTCEVPIVFMMYYNTILYYGLDNFVKKCQNVGVDGLIVPDLPFEEQKPLKAALEAIHDATYLLQLVSPVSGDRIPMILENAKGYVYCVSSMGVTGQDKSFYDHVENYLKEVKGVSKIPIMMGFGIRTAEDVENYKDIIDGAIVGSYFIKYMEQNNYDLDKIKEYVSTFKREF
ncbi:MAG: tryptophan synthase subunit alpha [Lachnospiraceae bacterium]|nr:tryptophan synthase subunit alpha [Lachnospiraceae bacterium]